jgi:hypothetical protein
MTRKYKLVDGTQTYHTFDCPELDNHNPRAIRTISDFIENETSPAVKQNNPCPHCVLEEETPDNYTEELTTLKKQYIQDKTTLINLHQELKQITATKQTKISNQQTKTTYENHENTLNTLEDKYAKGNITKQEYETELLDIVNELQTLEQEQQENEETEEEEEETTEETTYYKANTDATTLHTDADCHHLADNPTETTDKQDEHTLCQTCSDEE